MSRTKDYTIDLDNTDTGITVPAGYQKLPALQQK